MSQSYDFRGSIGSPFGAPYPSTPLSQRYPDEVTPLSQRRIDEPFATQPKEEPEEIEEPPEDFGYTVRKPRTRQNLTVDVGPGASGVALPENTVPYAGNSGHYSGCRRVPETNPNYAGLQQAPPWPFWVAAGSPVARLEPTWIDGAWYLVAPVDFKGMEQKMSRQRQAHELNTVDEALRSLDAEGNLPALPPPRHWKEHKSCPIA